MMSGPVKVFVAASAGEWLPMRVLEFSMRETSALPVAVMPIGSFNRRIPLPQDRRNQPRTPFSFQRFLIPEICGFEGRAIYLDADMQVFTDINALWSRPMEGHDVLAVSEGTDGRRGQFSVMLLDCARLQWRIEDIVKELDEGCYSYEDLMYSMCVAKSVGRTIDPGWNSLEKFEPVSTKLLHYTDMHSQPWVHEGNPNGNLWTACLRRAIDAGFISLDELAREVAQSHVRPSLLAEMQGQAMTPALARRMDARFVAPYRSIKSGHASPWQSWRGALKAQVRKAVARLRMMSGR